MLPRRPILALLPSLVIVLFLASVPVVAAAEEAVPWTDVLYWGEGNSRVYWVSLSLLEGRPRQQDHGLSKGQIENLRYALHYRNKDLLDCKDGGPYRGLSTMPPLNLVDGFGNNQFSGRGTVRGKDVGWNPFLDRVETLFYVEIEETFRDLSGRVQPGDYILRKEPTGRIDFSDGFICTAKPGRLFTPAVGEEIALAGAIRDLNAETLLIECPVGLVLPIRESVLIPAPDPSPSPSPISLHELRQALASTEPP